MSGAAGRSLLFVACLGAAACDFDAAFDRYCDANPSCHPDGGAESLDAGATARPWPTPRNCPDCGPGEICHPFGKVCMRVCVSPADCPAGESACVVVDMNGSPSAQRVCTCDGSSCGAGAHCSPVDDLCEEPCADNAGCASFWPPRKCKDGLCLPPPAPP
jgi:hypothetical protein